MRRSGGGGGVEQVFKLHKGFRVAKTKKSLLLLITKFLISNYEVLNLKNS